ncbi:hypothetical protein MTO96_033719 [Rhipicephalus appendiculatus]
MSARHVSCNSRANSGFRFKDCCWSVPFLAACLSVLFALPQTNVGLFYVMFMERFGVNREAASWAKTISSLTMCLMGFFIGAVQKKVSTYTLIFCGAILCPTALIISAFVPKMHWMCVTFGFLHGGGLGIISIATSVYIVSFFEKYRGLATGIQYLGISLSGIIGPSILSSIAAVYGLGGTMLLAGGITLNLLPLTLLLRDPKPIALHRCRRWKGNSVVKPSAGETFVEHASETIPCATVEPLIHDLSTLGIEVKEAREAMTETANTEATDPLRGPEVCYAEVAGVEKRFGLISQVLEVLRKPTFYVLLVPIVAADITLPLFAFTVVDYAEDKQVPPDLAAVLLSCQCAGGFLGRLVIPLVSDRTPLGRCVIGTSCFVLISMCFLLMPHVASFAAVAVVAFVAGIQQGYLATIKTVLVADYIGVQMVAVCWGITGLLSMPLLFCQPAVIGAFRDTQGSYDNLYRICGAVDLVAALLLGVQVFLDLRKMRNKR